MKTIGKTLEGEYLVEMSYDEHRLLGQLVEAVRGKVYGPWDTIHGEWETHIDADYRRTFRAIISFTEAMLKINTFQSYLDGMRNALLLEKECKEECCED